MKLTTAISLRTRPCAWHLRAPSRRWRAHESHEHFSAGEPGDPKKPSRIVKVKMLEDGKKMLFEPAVIEVRRGEQIRFVLQNDGTEDHEFMLASEADNRKHAEVMKKNPDMEHDDPNAKRLSPFNIR